MLTTLLKYNWHMEFTHATVPVSVFIIFTYIFNNVTVLQIFYYHQREILDLAYHLLLFINLGYCLCFHLYQMWFIPVLISSWAYYERKVLFNFHIFVNFQNHFFAIDFESQCTVIS